MNRRYYGAAFVLLWSTSACAATAIKEKTFDVPQIAPAQCVTVSGTLPGVKLDDALVITWDTDRPELSVEVTVMKNSQVQAHVCNESPTEPAAAGKLRVRTSGCK